MSYKDHTCDECDFYIFLIGNCKKRNIPRHSCMENACSQFRLARDLKPKASEIIQQQLQPDSQLPLFAG